MLACNLTLLQRIFCAGGEGLCSPTATSACMHSAAMAAVCTCWGIKRSVGPRGSATFIAGLGALQAASRPYRCPTCMAPLTALGNCSASTAGMTPMPAQLQLASLQALAAERCCRAGVQAAMAGEVAPGKNQGVVLPCSSSSEALLLCLATYSTPLCTRDRPA